jgi:hypothetical protein
MNFTKRLLMVSGAVALAAMVGVILTPKAAHGIVATLVQVVNTSANPVPTVSTDSHARTAVLLTIGSLEISDGQFSARGIFQNANGNFFVPAGQRLVIESVSGVAVLPIGQKPVVFVTNFANGVTGFINLAPALITSGDGLDRYVFASQITTYADFDLTLDCNRFPFTAGTAGCSATLSGHLESIQ